MPSKSYAHIASFSFLLFLLSFSFITNLGFIPIRIWDEGRVATNALNMYLNGNWIVTYFDGKPDMWNTKPPLLIWFQVISMKIFGVNEWSVRFPSAMASILTGLTLWFFCTRYFKKPWLGFIAGVVFASTYPFIYNHAGRTGDYDALLTLFSTLYCFCFYFFIKTNKNKWLFVFFCFLILAVLTKGIAGLFFTPALFIYAVLQKKLIPILKNRWFYIGMASFILIAIGYYFLREQYNEGYIKAVLENEMGRHSKGLDKNNFPFSWYVVNIFKWRYPYWFLFIVPAFIYGFLSRSKEVKKITGFNLALIVTYLLIISSASTKLYWYDIPIYPFLSLQIALMLYAFWLYVQRKLKLSMLIQKMAVASLLFALVFVYPFRMVYKHNKHIFVVSPWDLDVQQRNQGLFMQQAIRNNKDLNNYIFCYDDCRSCHGQIDFYIILLQSKNVNVRFQHNLDSLSAGSFIVVSQEKMKEDLEKRYNVELIDEAYGCSVYTIK